MSALHIVVIGKFHLLKKMHEFSFKEKWNFIFTELHKMNLRCLLVVWINIHIQIMINLHKDDNVLFWNFLLSDLLTTSQIEYVLDLRHLFWRRILAVVDMINGKELKARNPKFGYRMWNFWLGAEVEKEIFGNSLECSTDYCGGGGGGGGGWFRRASCSAVWISCFLASILHNFCI